MLASKGAWLSFGVLISAACSNEREFSESARNAPDASVQDRSRDPSSTDGRQDASSQLVSVADGAARDGGGEAAPSNQCPTTPLNARSPELAGVRFVEVTADSGDLAQLRSTPNGGWSSPDMYSGGVLFRDLDGDGEVDVVITRTGAQDSSLQGLRFLRGNGRGQFEDVTEASGLEYAGPAFGAVAADLDGNGMVDIFVTTDRDGDRLFFQRDPGVFEQGALEAGVDQQRPSRAAAVLDADGDGWLDLYVSTWNQAGPNGHEGGQSSWDAPNFLYLNERDGNFKDATAEADVACHGRSTLGVGAVDLDDDGDAELYVANDFFDDCLYENLGQGRFREISEASGIGPHAINAMGVASGDADGDGDIDLLISDDERPDSSTGNAYYENLGGLKFASRAQELGLDGVATVNQAIAVYWGTAMRDFDNDGALEIHVAQHLTGPEYIFQRQDDGAYMAVARADLGFNADSRGTGYADYDRDGRTDILIMSRGESPRLLRNIGSKGQSAVRVRLVGPRGNLDAVGSKVILEACGRSLVRLVEGNTGYLSASEPALTVGVGACDEPIRVSARLGAVQAFATVAPNHEIVLPLDGSECN